MQRRKHVIPMALSISLTAPRVKVVPNQACYELWETWLAFYLLYINMLERLLQHFGSFILKLGITELLDMAVDSILFKSISDLKL